MCDSCNSNPVNVLADKKFLSKKNIIEGRKILIGEAIEVKSMDSWVNIRRWTGLERSNLQLQIFNAFSAEDLSEMITSFDIDNITLKNNFPNMYNLFIEIVMLSCADEEGNKILQISILSATDLLTGSAPHSF